MKNEQLRPNAASVVDSRWRLVGHFVALLLGMVLFVAPGQAAPKTPPVSAAELCKTHITIDGNWLPYCRNERLGEQRLGIRRAVILIHGRRRNARSYYQTVKHIADELPGMDETLLLALQFLTLGDVRKHQLSSRFQYWTSEGWMDGRKALNGSPLSSFDVLDRVIKRLIEQNPNLETIVIAGHSAGSQFAQRHASGRKVDTAKWSGSLHYVLANAGSYMYLTRQRPGPISGCQKSFNQYRFGVENNRLAYFRAASPESFWRKFGTARVTVFLGDQDTDPKQSDQSCEAKAQGESRFDRGLKFFHFTQAYWPSSLPAAVEFRLQIVPGVGHEFGKMWDSQCGRSLLFGDGSCAIAPPPAASFPL